MKTTLIALAAVVGLAFAAPSFAATAAPHGGKTPVVKNQKASPKHKLVRKHKVAKLQCAKDQKIAMVKGKQQCVAK
ncbi:MAG: hypothetical protein ACREIP_01455 [Alphaproteobacteria bacterium]